MELLLMRHGIAADPKDFKYADEDRPLTAEGVEKMRQEAAGLQSLVGEIGIIVTSPLLRARQTAELVAEKFGGTEILRECNELAMGGSAKRILEVIAEYDSLANLLVVGHEPELVELTALLTGARPESIEIKKGAVICLKLLGLTPRPRAVLRWQMTAKQLKSVAVTN